MWSISPIVAQISKKFHKKSFVEKRECHHSTVRLTLNIALKQLSCFHTKFLEDIRFAETESKKSWLKYDHTYLWNTSKIDRSTLTQCITGDNWTAKVVKTCLFSGIHSFPKQSRHKNLPFQRSTNESVPLWAYKPSWDMLPRLSPASIQSASCLAHFSANERVYEQRIGVYVVIMSRFWTGHCSFMNWFITLLWCSDHTGLFSDTEMGTVTDCMEGSRQQH